MSAIIFNSAMKRMGNKATAAKRDAARKLLKERGKIEEGGIECGCDVDVKCGCL